MSSLSKNPATRKSKRTTRVGLRDIAREAGVCLMTVSLSLRDNPKISKPTRERVKRIAEEMGYRPDPEISRLMKHLRTSRVTRGSVGVGVIDFYPEPNFEELFHNRMIRQGVCDRAEELGFAISRFRAAEYKLDINRVLKVVRNRGLEAVVLLPPVLGVPISLEADWTGLCVISTATSIVSPRFHCVIPHQFANMMSLLDKAKQRGFRQIGAIFEGTFDDRTAHNFTAALKWHDLGERTLTTGPQETDSDKLQKIVKWLKAKQPDLVFAQTPASVEDAVRRAFGESGQHQVEIVGLGHPGSETHSYMDERADLIGSTAVDVLAGMVYCRETGIPTSPRTTMVAGRIVFHDDPAPAAPVGDNAAVSAAV